MTETTKTLRLAVFCVLLGVYLLAYIPRPDAIDGDATLAVAVSLVQHGRPDMAQLGAPEGLLPPMSRMGSFGVDGRLYAKKGVTPSLALLPFVLAAQAADWLPLRATAMLFNPLVTAGTGALLLTLLVHLGVRAGIAAAVALLWGLATFAIVYTKTLFGEPLAGLLLVSAALNATRYRQTQRPRALLVAGLALGLCLGVNLTYIVMLPLLAIYLTGWRLDRPTLRAWAGLALPVVVCGLALLAYNAARFGHPLTSGYNFAEGEGFTHPPGWGLFGLFLSPYRGLFWYNPLLLLALPGLWWFGRAAGARRMAALALGLLLAQAAAYAAWWSWHGGIVWGPRFLIPVTPLLMLGLVPLLLAAQAATLGGRLARLLLVGVGLLALGVQALGVLLDYQRYVAYLYGQYASGRVAGLVSGLRDAVLLEPRLSPIVGHGALLAQGAPLEPAVLATGDGVHGLAALALLALGGALVALRARPLRGRLPLVAGSVLIVLNVVAGRQMTTPNGLPTAFADLPPTDTLVVAVSNIGSALLDASQGTRAYSTIAPTQPDDPLAAGLWRAALAQPGTLAWVTWFAPGHPDNWQERALWQNYAFVEQRILPPSPLGSDLRALIFDLTPQAMTTIAGTWEWNGQIRLAGLETALTPQQVRVRLRWQPGAAPPERDYSWFVHLLDANGQIVAQQDRVPQGGYAMTATWGTAAAPIVDQLALRLPAGADPAGWQLRIGWVDPNSGTRLPLTAAASSAQVEASADAITVRF